MTDIAVYNNGVSRPGDRVLASPAVLIQSGGRRSRMNMVRVMNADWFEGDDDVPESGFSTPVAQLDCSGKRRLKI